MIKNLAFRIASCRIGSRWPFCAPRDLPPYMIPMITRPVAVYDLTISRIPRSCARLIIGALAVGRDQRIGIYGYAAK